MSAEIAGKYSRKHPAGSTPEPAIAAALAEVAGDGRIGCAVAHDLAAELAVSPADIGRTVDLLDYRIVKCQMGLFGYTPAKKIVTPATTVSDELRDQLLGAAVGGKIPCADCWRIAQALAMQKITVAAACEKLGLKVSPCQLGAF